MWIRTRDGSLLNLDRCVAVRHEKRFRCDAPNGFNVIADLPVTSEDDPTETHVITWCAEEADALQAVKDLHELLRTTAPPKGDYYVPRDEREERKPVETPKPAEPDLSTLSLEQLQDLKDRRWAEAAALIGECRNLARRQRIANSPYPGKFAWSNDDAAVRVDLDGDWLTVQDAGRMVLNERQHIIIPGPWIGVVEAALKVFTDREQADLAQKEEAERQRLLAQMRGEPLPEPVAVGEEIPF